MAWQARTCHEVQQRRQPLDDVARAPHSVESEAVADDHDDDSDNSEGDSRSRVVCRDTEASTHAYAHTHTHTCIALSLLSVFLVISVFMVCQFNVCVA